jgi:hypothetical protein
VKLAPFKHEPERARWKVASNSARFDLDRDLVFPIRGMEVREPVFPEEHADHHSQETGDLGHVTQAHVSMEPSADGLQRLSNDTRGRISR